MAKAPVLKTGGRKPLQVRILCPPSITFRSAEAGFMRLLAVTVGIVLSALPARAQTPYDTVFDQLKSLAARREAGAPNHRLLLHPHRLQPPFHSRAPVPA